ncbi:MAG: hypothetical protein ABSH16_01545 [Sedimentisphaerales bacterium]
MLTKILMIILKVVLKTAPSMILLLYSIYYITQENFKMAGILFIATGIIEFFWKFPYFMFLILTGLAIVLVSYKNSVFMKIGALIILLVVFVIIIFDLILLFRLMASGKMQTIDKSEKGKALEYLRENEITFMLWNKLTQKKIGRQ